jgi:hypothetical protein
MSTACQVSIMRKAGGDSKCKLSKAIRKNSLGAREATASHIRHWPAPLFFRPAPSFFIKELKCNVLFYPLLLNRSVPPGSASFIVHHTKTGDLIIREVKDDHFAVFAK